MLSSVKSVQSVDARPFFFLGASLGVLGVLGGASISNRYVWALGDGGSLRIVRRCLRNTGTGEMATPAHPR
jgi:hypothetical protein